MREKRGDELPPGHATVSVVVNVAAVPAGGSPHVTGGEVNAGHVGVVPASLPPSVPASAPPSLGPASPAGVAASIDAPPSIDAPAS